MDNENTVYFSKNKIPTSIHMQLLHVLMHRKKTVMDIHLFYQKEYISVMQFFYCIVAKVRI